MENAVATTANQVFYWIGTAMVLATFGCAVAWNFVGEKAKKVLNWVVLGTSLTAAICYGLHELL